ncbi:hypothetical protein AB1M95_09120 [Sulfitobacter sp. LCG007]
MRAIVIALCLALTGTAALADARLTVLMDLLKISETARIVRDEGLAEAARLETEYLDGRGGEFWAGQVDRLFAAEAIVETVRAALEDGLDVREGEAVAAFFASERGERIVTLENAARIAMNDPAIEAAMAGEVATLKTDPDRLFVQVERMIAAGDLTERNVAATLGASYQFMSGLAEGGLLEMDEDAIARQVWDDEARVRAAARDWLHCYLTLAYTTLSPEEVDAYVDFAESDAGRALNAALFQGYGKVYADTSYGLGRLIALGASASDL